MHFRIKQQWKKSSKPYQGWAWASNMVFLKPEGRASCLPVNYIGLQIWPKNVKVSFSYFHCKFLCWWSYLSLSYISKSSNPRQDLPNIQVLELIIFSLLTNFNQIQKQTALLQSLEILFEKKCMYLTFLLVAKYEIYPLMNLTGNKFWLKSLPIDSNKFMRIRCPRW